MATAAIYGLLASSSFVVGVLLGLATKPPQRRSLHGHGSVDDRGPDLGPLPASR